MKRTFVTHGFVYAGATLVSGIGTVVLVPVYTHALRPSEYGVVDYVGAMQVLLQICVGLEITQGIARFYSGAQSDTDRRAYASTGMWFMLACVALACAALYLMTAVRGSESVGLQPGSSVVGVALVSVYTRIMFYALQSQARWELRPAVYSVASLVSITGAVVSVSYLLLVRNVGVAGVFTGLSVGYGAGCLYCLVALRDTYRGPFDRGKFRQMLRFSLPLTFSSLAVFFANYGDRLILRSLVGFHELGVYGIAARIAAVITVVINGFQLGAAPLIYRHHDEPAMPATLAQLMRLFLAASLVGVVALAAFSIELVAVFTTPEYAAAWPIIPVLALAIVLASLYVFVPGLTIQHMTTRFALVNIATAIATLAATAGLLRLFGIVGAALGVLCGATAGFAMHAVSSQRVYRIPIEWRRITLSLLVVAASIGTSWSIGASGVLSLGIRSGLFVASSLAVVVILSTRQERLRVQHTFVAGIASRWSAA